MFQVKVSPIIGEVAWNLWRISITLTVFGLHFHSSAFSSRSPKNSHWSGTDHSRFSIKKYIKKCFIPGLLGGKKIQVNAIRGSNNRQGVGSICFLFFFRLLIAGYCMFYHVCSCQYPVIVCFLWLQKHNPHIDWLSRDIKSGARTTDIDSISNQTCHIRAGTHTGVWQRCWSEFVYSSFQPSGPEGSSKQSESNRSASSPLIAP